MIAERRQSLGQLMQFFPVSENPFENKIPEKINPKKWKKKSLIGVVFLRKSGKVADNSLQFFLRIFDQKFF